MKKFISACCLFIFETLKYRYCYRTKTNPDPNYPSIFKHHQQTVEVQARYSLVQTIKPLKGKENGQQIMAQQLRSMATSLPSAQGI